MSEDTTRWQGGTLDKLFASTVVQELLIGLGRCRSLVSSWAAGLSP
jgi:hypothetical protein